MTDTPVSRSHIDIMLHAVLDPYCLNEDDIHPDYLDDMTWLDMRGLVRKLTFHNLDEVGQMLHDANYGVIGEDAPSYVFTDPYEVGECYSICEVIAVARSYADHCSQQHWWANSEAHQFCRALIQALAFSLPQVHSFTLTGEQAGAAA